jgi:hypothetical protein
VINKYSNKLEKMWKSARGLIVCTTSAFAWED